MTHLIAVRQLPLVHGSVVSDDVVDQAGSAVHLGGNGLGESLGDHVGTGRAGVGVVGGVVVRDGVVAELLVHERDGVEVVDKGAAVTDARSGGLLVSDEARCGVHEGTSLPCGGTRNVSRRSKYLG